MGRCAQKGVARMKREKGMTLVEAAVALALLGIISVSFLGGVAATSSARATADQRASAKILAESILDTVKKQEYALGYNVTIPDEFADYSAVLDVQGLKNNHIQQLTVTVRHGDRDVLELQSWKVNR
jgi:type II secretory pathway pseudopilin PulG